MTALRKQLRGCPTVFLAQDVPVDHVVHAVRTGAADVIGLPAPAEDVVARACLHLRRAGTDDPWTRELVGESASIQHLRREITAVARTQSTVLITGETGVGKGLVAHAIHRASARRDRPFVHVDCSALASSLIESELFGHERGAFTGAVARRLGRFEVADNGTIFLDEIGDLELPLQRKLLRVLQEREYERLGGSAPRSMDARVIAATNRDLLKAVAEGTFRADLLFRLNVYQLAVPPLRERLGDLPLLVRCGLERLRERLQLDAPVLPDAFYRSLAERAWPGNVRELMNLLERIVVRHEARPLEEYDVARFFEESPQRIRWSEPRSPDCKTQNPASPCAVCPPNERDRVAEILLETGGNISRAARRLGLARSTLRYRLRIHGLTDLIPKD
jgi:two-component system NtrC family response regulator